LSSCTCPEPTVSLATTSPDTSQDVPVLSETAVLGDPSTFLSASIPVSQSSAESLSTLPSTILKQDEVAVLSEFLIFEDTSEFDKESSTRDVATNTSPQKECQTEAETQRLQQIIQDQERALRNNTRVILNLQRLLEEQASRDQTSRSIHKGPGEGERPQITSRRKSPALPSLKSVVFRPGRQRPRARPRSPRPSPLDNLFQPDRKKYRKHYERKINVGKFVTVNI
jgi:hypothetical protein